jgi:hypothetical protein
MTYKYIYYRRCNDHMHNDLRAYQTKRTLSCLITPHYLACTPHLF